MFTFKNVGNSITVNSIYAVNAEPQKTFHTVHFVSRRIQYQASFLNDCKHVFCSLYRRDALTEGKLYYKQYCRFKLLIYNNCVSM